jgi:hypothetical protein
MNSDESGAEELDLFMSRCILTPVTNLDLILCHEMQKQMQFGQWWFSKKEWNDIFFANHLLDKYAHSQQGMKAFCNFHVRRVSCSLIFNLLINILLSLIFLWNLSVKECNELHLLHITGLNVQ